MRRPLFRGAGHESADNQAMKRFLFFIDSLSMWVGKSFAWLILILTLGISYEVFARYIFRAPTTWAFDFSYITYGALFLMSGAYALSRGSHVRADVLYRLWKPRTQASLDLTVGPVWRAVQFQLGGGAGRLLLVVHHLVVDGVSWRILLQDLQQACEQLRSGVAAPSATTALLVPA